jgi:hypothetical protein
MDVGAYRALLAVPEFARRLTPARIKAYRKMFGYRTETWNFDHNILADIGFPVEGLVMQHRGEVHTRMGKVHRVGGPAVDCKDFKVYIENGRVVTGESPAAILNNSMLYLDANCKWTVRINIGRDVVFKHSLDFVLHGMLKGFVLGLLPILQAETLLGALFCPRYWGIGYCAAHSRAVRPWRTLNIGISAVDFATHLAIVVLYLRWYVPIEFREMLRVGRHTIERLLKLWLF